ncbi:MAG: tetraacyldisaccharide 4'-kinase [Acidobacteriota bacterium]
MLDLLYAQAARIARRRFERRPDLRRALGAPVVSVGNLSVGGTGKTPVAAALAAWLAARGERPAILSRGYGRARRRDGVVVVSDGTRVTASVEEAGDEPVLLARLVPGAAVLVCDDRVLAGRLAEARLGCTVHVLDDGFQQVGLHKDLDVLVTSVGEIPGGRVLPLGRLREPADAAARADVVVVMGADAAGARAEAWTLGVSQSLGARRVLGAPRPAGRVPDGPVVAFAGIGQPQQFFDGLRDAGWTVARTLAFPDHHPYGPRDAARIAAAVADAGATGALTTEKDAVRLEALGSFPCPLAAVPLSLAFDGWDALADAVAAAIDRARQRTADDAVWPPLAAPPGPAS